MNLKTFHQLKWWFQTLKKRYVIKEEWIKTEQTSKFEDVSFSSKTITAEMESELFTVYDKHPVPKSVIIVELSKKFKVDKNYINQWFKDQRKKDGLSYPTGPLNDTKKRLITEAYNENQVFTGCRSRWR